MTTKVTIENDATSNPEQHLAVTRFEGNGLFTTTRLAPGEKFEAWLHSGLSVHVAEVPAPKRTFLGYDKQWAESAVRCAADALDHDTARTDQVVV